MTKTQKGKPTAIICVPESGLAKAALTPNQMAWAKANNFKGDLGAMLPIPDDNGAKAGYLFGMGKAGERPPMATGLASLALQPGEYALQGEFGDPTLAALGFSLGAYRFNRYKEPTEPVDLVTVDGADQAEVNRLRDAAFLARDLINTPSNDLGPDVYEAAVRVFAKQRKMTVHSIVGDDLIKQNFPMIHAVGRASSEAPRLLDLSWGSKSDPKVTLVGKGVTFDTGGLSIKGASGMLLMKKDMGGSSNVLGLAHAIIDAGLKIQLRVLLPIVENAISGNAFRPGDVLHARNGMSVEIGNTDAEGRLILADALALADEESPELIIDMATLTGAARVGMGAELPPLYATSDEMAQQLQAHSMKMGDPLWHLPLWAPYAKSLSSTIADVNHIASGGQGGSIIAALFLQKFVKKAANWVHLDIYGWAPTIRAGQPIGGADQGARASYAYLKQKYGTK